MADLKLITRQRDEAIKKRQAIIDKAVSEKRGFTEDERKEANNLRNLITDYVEIIKEAEAEEEKRGIEEQTIQQNSGDVEPDKPLFRNVGQFVKEVHEMRQAKPSDAILQYSKINHSEMRAMNITDGSSLGYLVPDQFEAGTLQLRGEGGYVRQRARVIPAGEYPDARYVKVCAKQGLEGVYNGIEVNYVSEGVGGEDESKVKKYLFILDPSRNKIQYIYEVTLESLDNPTAVTADMQNTLNGAHDEHEDYLCIHGDGVGKPRGILNSKALKKIKRKTSLQFTFDDVLQMSKFMYPRATRRNWELSLDLYEQVAGMTDGSKRYIMLAGDATKGIPDILHGRPIHWNEITPVAGETGDAMLVDWSFYYLKDGSGPYIRTNPYTKFKQEIVQVIMTLKIDGDTWLQEPIKLFNGMIVSPFVALEAA